MCFYWNLQSSCTNSIYVYMCIFVPSIFFLRILIHVHIFTCTLYVFTMSTEAVNESTMYSVRVHVLMRDEKEGRKKQARSKKCCTCTCILVYIVHTHELKLCF